MTGIFLVLKLVLVNTDLGAALSLAGEFLLFHLLEADDAGLGCMNGVVTAHVGTVAGDFGSASLAH